MQRFCFIFAGLWLVLGTAALGAEPAFAVERTPPRIVRRTYDPQNPPAEMSRKLTLPEAGLCEFEFGCEIQTGTATPRYGLGTVQATVTSIRLIPRLDLTIWTVTQANAKLRAHEEGHRELCELYYQRVDAVALRLARAAIGTKLTIDLRRREASTQEALDQFQNKLLEEFLRETARRCTIAQARYDLITAHGVNPIPEAEAITQAVADERSAP